MSQPFTDMIMREQGMSISLKMKIIIILMIIYSILFFANLGFILGWTEEMSEAHRLFAPAVLIAFSLVLGILVFTSRTLREKDNRLIRIMLLINPCLLNLLILATILSTPYIDQEPEIMVIMLIVIQLSIPLSFIIGAVWAIKRVKAGRGHETT
jgi:hypothetical protein